MAVFFTGISVLFLLVCQVHQARGLKNAEINARRDSLTRLTDVSEEIFRNPRHFDKWSKTIQRTRKCTNGRKCDGKPNTSIDESKECHGNLNCSNKIKAKVKNQTKKDNKERFAMNFTPDAPLSGFKRILEASIRKSPCPAENPKCERKRAVLTTSRISYQCPTGLWCAQKRNYRRKAVSNHGQPRVTIVGSPTKDHKEARRTKGGTAIVDNILRITKRCTSELRCSERNGEKEEGNGPKAMKNSRYDESFDKSSNKLLQDNKLDQNCPVGLWCSSKREPGLENSESFKNCPPGLWCKRNEVQIGENSFSKRASKREDYQCPTGLWCSTKREKGYENFETQNDCPPGLWCKRDETTPQETDIATFKDYHCPNGLWCTSKKEVGYQNAETLPHCPPGLWCKKNTISDNTEVRNIGVNCPTGFQCSFKRYMGYENSETLRKCPPGLWCRRSVQRDSESSIEQMISKRQNIPTGLRSALKRDVGNIALSDGCPPGLWCKRNGAKIQEAIDESMDNCAKVSWCSLKRKLGIANKDAVVRSKFV